MMMQHPVTLLELQKAQYKDLLADAEARRLVRQAEAAHPAPPNLVERLVDAVGTILVRHRAKAPNRSALA
jgi:hypothetical protein